MLEFPLVVAHGANKLSFCSSKMSFLMFLRSRDVENWFCRVNMIQIEIVNVVGR